MSPYLPLPNPPSRQRTELPHIVNVCSRLDTLELPSVPLPELAFDLDADGEADVLLEIRDATFVPVDTTSDGVADWICILSDLRSAPQ